MVLDVRRNCSVRNAIRAMVRAALLPSVNLIANYAWNQWCRATNKILSPIWHKYIEEDTWQESELAPELARLDMQVSAWHIREISLRDEKWNGSIRKYQKISPHKTHWVMNNRFLMISLRWSCWKSLYWWCKIEFVILCCIDFWHLIPS